MEARACQPALHSSQVNQGAYRVEMRSGQIDQSESQVNQGASQGVENAGCPSLARRRSAACLAELRRSAAARLVRVALAWSVAPPDILRHEVIDPHRRVVNVGRQANPVSQCHGRGEGGRPSLLLGLHRATCGRRTNIQLENQKSRRIRNMHKQIRLEQRKGSALYPNNASCKVTRGVTPDLSCLLYTSPSPRD